MRLVTYTYQQAQTEQTGFLCRGMVVNCASALAYFHRNDTPDRLLMQEIISQDIIFKRLEAIEGNLQQLGSAEWTKLQQHGWIVSPQAISLKAPLPQPRSLRDFYAFEAHVQTCRAKRGLEMVEEWYQLPAFYFSNHQAIFGPQEVIHFPKKALWRDFELEVAIIIGRKGRDIAADSAWDYVFGLSILNDWSARDIQAQEVKVGLGPAKGKDFATTIGPYIATAEEWCDRQSGQKLSLNMKAYINGHQVSEGNTADLYWSIPQLIERASADVTLYPGDVIGTGTVGTGCLLEQDNPTWLQSGDIVMLEVERLGQLQNRIG